MFLVTFFKKFMGIEQEMQPNPTHLYLDWCEAEEQDEEWNLLYRG